MSRRLDRRTFLKTASAAAVSAPLWGVPDELQAQASADPDAEKNFIEPEGLTGEPLKLPAWSYGKHSSAPDTMLMFRGDASHTFYGTGQVRDKPEQRWSQTLARFHTTLRGKKVIWTGTGWSGQPVKYGDFVFVGGQGGYVYAFEAATGVIRWRYQGKRMFKGSPCVYENRLYTGNTDDMFRCIDLATGKLVWQLNTGTDCDSSGVVFEDRLYVAGESGFVHCLDPRTGKHHWKTEIGGTGKGTLGGSNGSETSPAIADGELFAATYDGFMYCLDVKTGKIKWRVSTGDDTDVSAVIVQERVYIAAEEQSPYLYCFDREKRGEVIWSIKNNTGWWSTPAVVQDRLYAGSNDGKLLCLDAKTGKSIWEYRAPAGIWSSPAVVEDRVVFGCKDPHLYMLDAKTGKFIWRGDMGGRTLSTPIIVDGVIYVGSSAGEFKSFG